MTIEENGRMTRERIEDMREIVLPFVKKRLLETNYENLGESDAEMFAKDFDEILNLATKALEQESVLDKIRVEIEKEIIPRNSDQYDHEAMWQNMGLRMALKAIDKYQEETEKE